MAFTEHDTVVLTRDVKEHGLRVNDLGAVVAVLAPDALEVEFVTAGGMTQALVTLRESDLRKLQPQDVLAVRPAKPAA
jgi:hypothetical protein